MAVVGGRQVDGLELGVMASGAGLFVLSFLPWFSTDDVAVTAWQAGALAGLSVLCSVIAALVVAARTFTTAVLPEGWRLATLAVTGTGTAFLLLKVLVGYHLPLAAGGVHAVGRGAGVVIALLVSAAQSACAYLAQRQPSPRW